MMAEKSSHSNNVYVFNSFDTDVFWLDKPGDTTVRPIPPERLERAKALRAQILKAKAEQSKHGTQPD